MLTLRNLNRISLFDSPYYSSLLSYFANDFTCFKFESIGFSTSASDGMHITFVIFLLSIFFWLLVILVWAHIALGEISYPIHMGHSIKPRFPSMSPDEFKDVESKEAYASYT